MNKSIDTIQFNSHLNRSITNLLVVVISGFLEAHNKEVKLIENGEVNREENFSLKLKIIVAKGLQLKESVIPTVNYAETGEWKVPKQQRKKMEYSDEYFAGDKTDDSGTSASENSDDETGNIHMAKQRIITQITENSEDTESSLSQAKQLLQLLNDQAFNIVSDGHQQVAYLVNHRTMTCSC